ncbi:MAG: hypothetical protein LBU91_05840, partial [Bacteroidales bacterium]|nr:hypothetical protein [Bacteroidales bacterium]
MKFNILPEEEIIHKALNGSKSHLNLLLSIYEPFIEENIGKLIKNYPDALDVRQRVCCKIIDHIENKTYLHQDKFSHW